MQLLRSAPARPREAAPAAGARAAPLFDWLIGLLSCWLTGGLFLDGWAHNHLGSMETFFTPWHAAPVRASTGARPGRPTAAGSRTPAALRGASRSGWCAPMGAEPTPS